MAQSPVRTPTLAARDGRMVAPAAATDSPLAVRGLTVAYGQAPAVFSVDMTVADGSMTAIVGPNGAGKSTLLKAVLGIIPRLSGTVEIYGVDIEAARHRVAYVPQRSSVDWDFPVSVIDVVLMGMSRQLGLMRRIREGHRRAAMDCLERVGMAGFADRQIGQLSGGQQQRVFLARALAQNADLFLLDEPFAGVDAATERAIVAVLKSLGQQGRTVVAVHHDLSTLTEYFDRVLLMNVRPIAEGPIDAVLTDAALQEAYGGRLATSQLSGAGPAGGA